MVIEVLVGPIASGKSTYSEGRAYEGAIIVNDDSIVKALHAGEYTLYNTKLKPLYKLIETQIIYSSISLGKEVVIDRTNLSRETRKRYISIAKSLDTEVNAIIFSDHGPEHHAKQRFRSDGRGYSYEAWLEVAKKHGRNTDPVFYSEGFDKILDRFGAETYY